MLRCCTDINQPSLQLFSCLHSSHTATLLPLTPPITPRLTPPVSPPIMPFSAAAPTRMDERRDTCLQVDVPSQRAKDRVVHPLCNRKTHMSSATVSSVLGRWILSAIVCLLFWNPTLHIWRMLMCRRGFLQHALQKPICAAFSQLLDTALGVPVGLACRSRPG